MILARTSREPADYAPASNSILLRKFDHDSSLFCRYRRRRPRHRRPRWRGANPVLVNTLQGSPDTFVTSVTSKLRGARARIRRAGDLPWLLAAIGLMATQQVAIRRIATDGAAGQLRRSLFLLTTLVLVALALRFRRYFGAWVIAGGIVLNLVPILAHGGLMPVSYAVVHDSGAFPEITEAQIGHQLGNGKDILLNDADIHFAWLSDRYTVTAPVYGTNIYSLGDFVLFAGIALVVLQAGADLLLPPIRSRRAAHVTDRAPLA